MPISTNAVQPKPDHAYDKFMQEVRDEQSGETAIISRIPRHVITTSNMKRTKAPRGIPRDFPTVRKVAQKTPAIKFIQTSQLADLRRKAVAAEKAASATPVKRATKKASPRKKKA